MVSMSLPILLVPGLACTDEVFAPQISALWPYGSVMVANTLDGDSMATMAASILAAAPPQFALGGISMGGYLCFEIIRQAPERVLKLALLDTSARPDRPEAAELRRSRVALVRQGDVERSTVEAFPAMVHPDHLGDQALMQLSIRMTRAIGAEAFSRQQEAIIARPDSRPGLGAIRVPTLMLVGEADQMTPPEVAREIAEGIPGARLSIVPQSGHMSTHENAAVVNAALVEWARS